MHTNMNIYRLVQRRSMACSNFNTYIHTYIHFDICKYAFLVYIFSIHTHICTDRLTQRRSVARSDFNCLQLFFFNFLQLFFCTYMYE